MEREPRPMPQVTITDPRQPGPPADVLVSGDERVPLDPAVRRRRLRVTGATLLLVALVAGSVEVRDRRAQAAQERRLGSVVDLRADLEGSTSGVEPGSRTAELTLQVLLHNDGPREVQVMSATAAGHQLSTRGVRIAAGGRAMLRLDRTVTCDRDEPPVTPDGGLLLSVRTLAGGERDVDVELPVDVDEAARICGFLPFETLRIAFGAVDRRSPEVVDLELDVEALSVGKLRLVGLTPSPGVAVQVRAAGQALTLPLELLALDALNRGLGVTLRLTVQDCAAALAPAGPDLPAPQDPRSLLVQVADQDGSVGDALVGYPDGLLDSLLAESC